jgi:hypothetical protein
MRNNLLDTRRRVAVFWMVIVTVLTEAVTIYLRFGKGVNAVDFNKTAPLLLQFHHAFWCIPLFVLALLFWRWLKLSGAFLGVGCGFIASDTMHHLIVLPLTVGNMGLHWP